MTYTKAHHKIVSNQSFYLLQESVAMARLKRDLVRFTGNVHFYKVGQTYVVSHIDTESRQQADNGCVTDQNKAPENESEG